jgi:GNAT superfamily N-acetyltransferase
MAPDKDISLQTRIPTVGEYRQLRSAIGWTNGDPEAQSAGLNNALFSVCLICAGKVIGCGRVIDDGGNYFYIQDIIVLPEHQGQGLGKLIRGAVMEYIKKNARAGAFIGLMAAQGVAPFYERYGFIERDADRPGMWFMVS